MVAFAAATVLAAAALPAGGNVALVPPAPCNPGVVINDPNNDGHHEPTDVLSAWLSESNGGNLQAVITVDLGNWDAEHDDPLVEAGYVFLFTKSGVTRFVRLKVDEDFNEAYDYGTYNPALTDPFVEDGVTTGSVDPPLPQLPPATVDGTAVIDVPTSVANDGDLLTNNFVLTYDGLVSSGPTWVDVAPGGENPTQADPGPSFTVGSCTAVSIAATPGTVKGSNKTATISGTVEPAAAGVDVTITREGLNTQITNTTTDVNGDYSVVIPVKETTRVHAEANGISSTTRTITVRSTVTIRKQRLANGQTRISGMTGPWLPGRVLLLKTTAFVPTAKKDIQGGAFSFTRRLSPGRYQVIYIPKQNRAVRSTSAAVRVQ